MCMRKTVLKVGEKIFNVFFVLFFIAGTASGVMAGKAVGGNVGWMTAISQVLMFWGVFLVIVLIVYSLIDIRHLLLKENENN